MRAFKVTIRQAGRVIRVAALARCSVDALVCFLDSLDSGAPFSICVREMRHGEI